MKRLLLPLCLSIAGCNDYEEYITENNHAPTIEALSTIKAVAGKTTKVSVTASDKDGDTLTYSLVSNPSWVSIQDNIISIAPSSANAGNHVFKVKVSDGVLTAEVDAALVVNLPMTPVDPDLVNHAPTIEALSTIKAVAGKTTKVSVTASDKDGDTLTYSLVSNPSWVSIQDNIISIAPSSANAGNHVFKVKVSDGVLTAEVDAALVVNLPMTPVDPDLVNHAPTIEALSTIKAVAGKTTKVSVTASDKDGDTLTYSLVSNPSWVSIQDNIISIAPSSANAGNHVFKVKVSDGVLTAEVDAALVVNLPMTPVDPDLVNHAPTIEALSTIKAVAGKTTKVSVTASDKDGDTLTYSLVNNPSWVSIQDNIISIAPSSANAGNHVFKVKVSDGVLTAEVDAALVVNLPMTPVDPDLVNHAPTIEALSTIKAVAGKTTKVSVTASDKDGDTLTYSLVSNPSWVSIQDNIISIAPSSANAGNHVFKVKVSDGVLTAEVDAALVVNLPMTPVDPDLVNHAPTIEALSTIKAVAGKTTKVSVTASDKDGDTLTYSLVNNPSWVSIQDNIISIAPSSANAGNHVFKVKVSDGVLTAEVDAALVVNLPMTPVDPDLVNHAPTIEALSTIKAVAGKTTKVSVTASDKDGDTLTYSLVNNPSWVSIQDNIISIAPSSANAGNHVFKVKVSDGVLTAEVDAALVVNLPMTPVDPDLVNHAPTIEALSTIKAVAGKTTKVSVTASDKDGDTLTYSLVNNPSWVSIQDNIISMTPSPLDEGVAEFLVIVSDGMLSTRRKVIVDVFVETIVLSATKNSENKRNVELAWEAKPRKHEYQIYRNETLIDKVSSESYDDVMPLSTTSYSYKIKACDADNHCEIESNVKQLRAEPDKIFVKVQGLDTTVESNKAVLQFYYRSTSKLWVSANFSFNKNETRHIIDLGFDTRYMKRMSLQPINGQICSTDKLNVAQFSNGNDVHAVYSCQTAATLVAEMTTVTIQKGSINQVGSPLILSRQSDGANMTSNDYIYESSNPSVVNVNKQGLLSGVSVGESTITVTANPDNYGEQASTSYKVIVDESTHYIMNKMDFGQQLLLPQNNEHQVITAGVEFLVRGFPVALDISNTKKPNLTFIAEVDGIIREYQVFCPEQLPLSISDDTNYTLSDSCYAYIQPDAVSKGGSYYFKDLDSDAKFFISPSINKPSHLKLVIVPLVVNEVAPIIPDLELIKARILETMPIKSVDISIRAPYVYSEPMATHDLGAFLSTVNNIRQREDNSGTHYMGILTGVCGVNGLAYIGSWHSAVIKDERCGGVNAINVSLIHELGHNLSLKHAPCGGASGADSFWTKDPQPWVGARNGAMSDAPIFSLKAQEILIPGSLTTKADIMGYCGGWHFSEYNHRKMALYIENNDVYNIKPDIGMVRSNSKNLVTIVSGKIVNGVVYFDPTSVSTSTRPQEIYQGEYELIVSSDYRYKFDVVKDSNEDILHFNVEIPYTETISSLAIEKNSISYGTKVNVYQRHQMLVNAEVNVSAGHLFVKWDNTDYPWLTAMISNESGSNMLLEEKNTRGYLDAEIPKYFDDNVVTLIFSNGLDTNIQQYCRKDLKYEECN
ncbi:Ig-like domain-containing protein [Vibrio campbellii]|uniref:Ig-like domain-containing protein n=1 Tax=Vibrio campbellii TaxID=680 RepID=UPI000CD3660B|nr:Ig-like domain-containing protein [Vibrio campbellii]AUW07457.1 hypothetical protein C1N51_27805 [Vibrio campbellii]